MLPEREGRYKAYPLDWGISLSGSNRLVTFVCRFRLLQELVGDTWVPMGDEHEIKSWSHLEKKDGTVNSITVDNLKAAFGWNGQDALWLDTTDLSQCIVQLTIAGETFEGRYRLKVQWINAEDAEPAGVSKADEATRQKVGVFNANLRAHFGGVSAQAPMPAAGSRPALPAQTARPSATPASEETAWKAFSTCCPAGWPQEQEHAEWYRVLAELFPGRNHEELTPEEWARFTDEAPSKIVVKKSVDDDCPF